MPADRKLPAEIVQFETFLKKPNSDPTGLAGFFNPGEIWVTRVPARLDVMGGISDYSGSNVCEGVLGRGMVIALQPRTDRTLRIRTMQGHHRSLPVETRIPLDYFEMGEGFVPYETIRALCQTNPISSWAAYVGGSIFTLLKEEAFHLPYGFSLLLLSGVPMNVGIAIGVAYTGAAALAATGGTPRRVTEHSRSYWHGWSPDGAPLTYTAARQRLDGYRGALEFGRNNRIRIPGPAVLG